MTNQKITLKTENSQHRKIPQTEKRTEESLQKNPETKVSQREEQNKVLAQDPNANESKGPAPLDTSNINEFQEKLDRVLKNQSNIQDTLINIGKNTSPKALIIVILYWIFSQSAGFACNKAAEEGLNRVLEQNPEVLDKSIEAKQETDTKINSPHKSENDGTRLEITDEEINGIINNVLQKNSNKQEKEAIAFPNDQGKQRLLNLFKQKNPNQKITYHAFAYAPDRSSPGPSFALFSTEDGNVHLSSNKCQNLVVCNSSNELILSNIPGFENAPKINLQAKDKEQGKSNLGFLVHTLYRENFKVDDEGLQN